MVICQSVIAQQLPINNQSFINRYSLSPAFAGLNGNIESFLGYRQNWVGVEGAPKTQSIDINGPLSAGKMGYGVTVTADQTGNMRHFYSDFTFAYHLQMGSDMNLSFGLTPKIYRNQIDLAQVKSFGNQQDPLLQNNSALVGTNFDLGINVLFSMQNLFVGLIVPRTIGMKMNYKESSAKYSVQRQYGAHLSYIINSGNMTIEPMVVVRKTQNSPLNYEAAVMANFNKRIWANLAYHAGSIIGIGAGMALGERMIINYTYELGIGGINSKSSGTHEISMGFLIKPADQRKEPTIFPPSEEKKEEDTKMNEEVEKRLKKVETDLKNEIATRDKQIKDLDGRLKKLEKNIDDVDAGQWEKPFILQNIKFGNNSDKLFSSSFPELNKLIKRLKDEPDAIMKISGYTDNVGSPIFNQKLSERRANAIKEYLVTTGSIDEKRIVVEGKGLENPVGDNNTPEGRAANRRIEAAFKKN